MTHILIVDDEAVFARNAALYLGRAGHEVTVAGTAAAGRTLFDQKSPDIVVLDYRLPDATGLDVIEHIRASDKTVPILLITGHGSIELAVEAMKSGANDLLTKPVSLSELRSRLELLAQRQRESSRLNYFESRERQAGHEILGQAPEMLALQQRIERIVALESSNVEMLLPILITGETGAGKELVARACHYRSERRQRPFIEISCAALPGELLESELFGHERGAFDDAPQRKLGLLEAADGGTLFLDEIGDMDLALQAKLLKVIEDGRFRRVGSVQEQQAQVRIVAATNQDLEARSAQGQFRADLYFRLRVLQLQVPPLRQRAGDAVLLARHFCQLFVQRYRREGMSLSPAAEAAIAHHAWPGNVRELRNVVEQAVMLGGGPMIQPEDLMLAPVEPEPGLPALTEVAADGGSTLDRVERELLIKALRDARNNVSRAARQLGISRDTLRYRLEKHGLRA